MSAKMSGAMKLGSSWAARSLALVLLVASPSSIARAAGPTAEDKAAAETLFSDARQLMERGEIADACLRFAESYRLEAAPGTLLNLALCHEKEGKVASAWAEYRESVIQARRYGRADREAVATERAANLEPHLPKLVVVVPAEATVRGLEVLRDGTPLLQGAWGTPLPVDPGEVLIEARAPLRRHWSLKVTAQAGEASTVTVPVLAVDEEAVAAVKPSFWTPRKTVAVIAGAAGVVGVGVGTYFGVAALASKKDANAACPSEEGQLRCSQAGASDSQRAVRQAWGADIGLGVGIVAVAAGAVLYLTDRRRDEPSPSPAARKVELTSLGAAGAAVTVRW